MDKEFTKRIITKILNNANRELQKEKDQEVVKVLKEYIDIVKRIDEIVSKPELINQL
jgi:hypothetical protein